MERKSFRMRYAIIGLLILVVLSSGCFEERLGEIVYDEYVPKTLPPVVGPGPGMGIYNTNCAGCHAMSGVGTLPGAPDFTDATYFDKADDEIINAIKDGVEGTQMPGWSQLSDEEIEDTLKYMKSFAGIT
jgi:mono/diheme cytochrome c family protein